MRVYTLSHQEMETLHSLRAWLGEIIKNQKLAKSKQYEAANFAIDLSEILSDSMCAELEVTNP